MGLNHKKLLKLFPPSEACSCYICVGYCKRPGWWTITEAKLALDAGLASQMMLEISPELNFGILSPAFKGNEGKIALQVFSENGCTFLKNNLCELFGTGYQPLECRFCHHEKKGEGRKCHQQLEYHWQNSEGQELVAHWLQQTGIYRGNRTPGIRKR